MAIIFSLSLLLAIFSANAQSECPWDFTFSDLCDDYNPVIGGDCYFNASEPLGLRRCNSNARSNEVCQDVWSDIGYSCYNKCQNFHATCCCFVASEPAESSMPTAPTTAAPTEAPTKAPTVQPSIATLTQRPTNTLSPSKSPVDQIIPCAWTGFSGTCPGYQCVATVGNGAFWRRSIKASLGCAPLTKLDAVCQALCTAFHVSCCQS
uniref:Uncharacterized protein n=1 Tax=Proboscia inermis TaxID=420281 RepID=A0A7S0GIT6_9STRA